MPDEWRTQLDEIGAVTTTCLPKHLCEPTAKKSSAKSMSMREFDVNVVNIVALQRWTSAVLAMRQPTAITPCGVNR